MAAGVLKAGQLTKLATELETLLRAGSPIGPGLRDASRRWRGPLVPAAENLAQRLDSGVPMDEALRSCPELPTAFRSLAAAGLATDRAADVLNAYSASTRQLLDLRERLLRGLMYPAIILVMTYGLTILLVHAVLPHMAEIVTEFSKSPPRWAGLAMQAKSTLHVWSWAIPLGVLAIIIAGHLLLGRRHSVVGWWGVLPVVRTTLADIHTSTASHLLASLLACEVPLPLALSLSAESLSSPRARAAVEAVADDIRSGIPAHRSFQLRAGAPPLWRALFARETEPGPIRAGLQHVVDVLAERARERADFLGRVIPVVMIVVVGGLTVGAYSSVVFGPLVAVWRRLGGPA